MPAPTLESLELRVRDLEEKFGGFFTIPPTDQQKLVRLLKPTKDIIGVIQKIVCTICDITLLEMNGKSKPERIIIGRRIAMALCAHLSQKPLAEIGRRFGDRDHGTVMHARDTAKDLCETNTAFKELYGRCEAAVMECVNPPELDYQI